MHVAAGTYREVVNAAQTGIAIVGSGSCGDELVCTIISPTNGTATVVSLASGDSLSHARLDGTSTAVPGRQVLDLAGDVTVDDVRMVMKEQAYPSGVAPAVVVHGGGSATIGKSYIDGTWGGSGIEVSGGLDSLTVRDTRIHGPRTALLTGASTQTLIQRSALATDLTGEDSVAAQTLAQAGGGSGSVRIDSSLILGGYRALAPLTPLTVTGSTIDPGLRGGDDRTAVVASTGTDSITGSIVAGAVEAAPGAHVSCRFSDVPSTQTAQVDCPSGAGNGAGNSFSDPLELYLNLPGGNYRLKPGSPAVDSGPAAPLGAGESLTDLNGSLRVLDGDLDCHARRDKGAYELIGYAATCPPPPPRKPPARKPPVDQGSGSPPADRTAPKISRVRIRPSRRLRFRLSETATVSVRFERRRRARYRRLYSLTVRRAKAGANVVKLPRRLRRKLRRGRYRVLLRARDAAGNRSRRVALRFRTGAHAH